MQAGVKSKFVKSVNVQKLIFTHVFRILRQRYRHVIRISLLKVLKSY